MHKEEGLHMNQYTKFFFVPNILKHVTQGLSQTQKNLPKRKKKRGKSGFCTSCTTI